MPAREKQKTRNLEFDFLVTLVFDFVFDSPLTQVEKLEYFRFRECISVRRRVFFAGQYVGDQLETQRLLNLPLVLQLLSSFFRTTREVTKVGSFQEQKPSTSVVGISAFQIGRAHV